MIARPLVVVFGFAFLHAPLEARHLHPDTAGPVERAPDRDEHTECHAQVADDGAFRPLRWTCDNSHGCSERISRPAACVRRQQQQQSVGFQPIKRPKKIRLVPLSDLLCAMYVHA